MGKSTLAAAGGAAVLLIAGPAGAVGFKLDITTSYQFGCPAGAVGYCGSPETGFATFTNVGGSTFVGTIGDAAVTSGGTDYSQSFTVTLAPGQHFTFGVAPDSSEVGGFNGPPNFFQSGVDLLVDGVFSSSMSSTPIDVGVDDVRIESGVFRTSPCDGITTDAFVLQGGSPTGCDNGEAFETSQAPGHFTIGGVPEPMTWQLMLVGFGGLGSILRGCKVRVSG
jgi:hypothetical protein